MSKRSFFGRLHDHRIDGAHRANSLSARKLRCEPLEDRRLLAVVTVNTPNDVVDFNDGRTSLREAIFATNVVPGHDEIVFDFGHDGPQTITLTGGQLLVTDSLTITGAGPDLLTIDASGSDPTPDDHNGDGSRVFQLSSGRGPLIEVSISGVRLTGGDVSGSGGAIGSMASLMLYNVEVVSNHARFGGGGLSLSGTAILDNTIVRDNATNQDGGGIRVQSNADVTIRNSTIIGNLAGSGGGGLRSIRLASTKIYDSLIKSNVAATSGGGIDLVADNTTIVRTRIIDNYAGVGAGIYTSIGQLQLEESFLAGNRATNAGGGFESSSSTVDVVKTVFTNNMTTANDSRGGAIHILSGTLSLRDATFNANSARSDLPQAGKSQGGAVSILQADVAITGGQFLNNSAASQGGAISADASSLHINDVLFQNNKSTGIAGAVWAGNSVVEIDDSQFQFNSAQASGGAVFVDSSSQTPSHLRIHDSSFTNNIAAFVGGAIAAWQYENVEIHQSLFRNNSTQSTDGTEIKGGGAIYALSTSDVTISESVFQQNSTPESGGALRLNGSASIKSSLIADNRAELSGGGIWLSVGSNHEVRIESTSLVRNHAGGDGGAMFAGVGVGNFSISNSTISQNAAADAGGGMYFRLAGRGPGGVFHVAHSTIASNQAGNGAAGGGIFASGGTLVYISHSIVHGNETDLDHQDIATTGTGAFDVHYALIGGIAPGTPVTADHLQLGINPQLQPLAPNGSLLTLPGQSRLLTHALLPNTPAVDAGEPASVGGVNGVPEFDQRGAPFSRVAIGNLTPADSPVIDLGAFELQPTTGRLHADFDGDGRVSGRDFLLWQRGYSRVAAATQGDGDATGNGKVDSNDLEVWQATYGNTVPTTDNRPSRLTAQSVTTNESPALHSVAYLQSGDGPTRRAAPSIPSRISRLDCAKADTRETEGQKPYRQRSEAHDSVMSNIPIRKAQIDLTLEDPAAEETDFADLVDYLLAR